MGEMGKSGTEKEQKYPRLIPPQPLDDRETGMPDVWQLLRHLAEAVGLAMMDRKIIFRNNNVTFKKGFKLGKTELIEEDLIELLELKQQLAEAPVQEELLGQGTQKKKKG